MEKDEILEIESMLSKLTNSMDILNYTTISSLAPDRCCLRIFFMEASMPRDYDESAETML